MTKMTDLKTAIAEVCTIAKWNPTQEQLNSIALEIIRTKPNSASDVEAIVAKECPDTIFLVMEGIDNSDIRTLLSLAIAATKK